MRTAAHALLLALLLLANVDAQGQPSTATEPASTDRPKIGLVLGGGGARGTAHVGVLKVLEELRVPIDFIAGNSMGALIGGVYAYGSSPADMDEILTTADWGFRLNDGHRRDDLSYRRKQDDRNFLVDLELGYRDGQLSLPKGLVRGHHSGNLLKFLVRDSYRIDDFDDLNVPYRCVATDIGTGEAVVLESGSLPVAMAASMAVPGAFAPVVIDGRELVDGLVVNNVPVNVARDMGADVLIVVDVGTPLLRPGQIGSLFDVFGQTMAIQGQKNVDEQLATLTDTDLLIQPDLGDLATTDFERAAEGIAIGEAAARAVVDQLRRFSVSEAEFATYLRRQRRIEPPPPAIASIEIEHVGTLSDDVIRGLIRTKVGDPFERDAIEADLERVYGLRDFERVTYRLDERSDDRVDLTVLADEKSWGPNYLRFGLNLVDDFDGNTDYNLNVNVTSRPLNSLGGEWRNEFQIGQRLRVFSEFFQPLTTGLDLFVAPVVEYEDFDVNVFQATALVAEAEVRVGTVGFDVGTNLSNWGQIRAGVRRLAGDIDIEITTTPIMSDSFDDAVFRLLFEVDTLDETNFPTRGVAGSVEWLRASTDLGADQDYERLAAQGAAFTTFDRTTIGIASTYITALDEDLPPFRLATLGGFLNLSGLELNELTDQHAFSVRGITYHQVSGKRNAVLGFPIYLGGSIEGGRVATNRDDLFDDILIAGSGFLGADTPLGPFYAAYGMTEGGLDSVYVFLGQTF